MTVEETSTSRATPALEDTAKFAPGAAHDDDTARPSDVNLPPVEITLAENGEVLVRGEATIHYIAGFHEQLKQLSRQLTDRVSIDLSGLASLDTAGAQALIAFKRARPTVSVHACPAPIRQFLELTGLTCLLTDEEH